MFVEVYRINKPNKVEITVDRKYNKETKRHAFIVSHVVNGTISDSTNELNVSRERAIAIADEYAKQIA